MGSSQFVPWPSEKDEEATALLFVGPFSRVERWAIVDKKVGLAVCNVGFVEIFYSPPSRVEFVLDLLRYVTRIIIFELLVLCLFGV